MLVGVTVTTWKTSSRLVRLRGGVVVGCWNADRNINQHKNEGLAMRACDIHPRRRNDAGALPGQSHLRGDCKRTIQAQAAHRPKQWVHTVAQAHRLMLSLTGIGAVPSCPRPTSGMLSPARQL